MSIVLVCTFTPKPDGLDDLLEAMKPALAAVHAENGCEKYALHKGEDRVILIEKWADEDSLAAHGSGEAIKDFGRTLKDRLATRPEIVKLTPEPAGSDSAGAI